MRSPTAHGHAGRLNVRRGPDGTRGSGRPVPAVLDGLEPRRLMAAGPEFRIDAGPGGSSPEVATNADGRSVVVWQAGVGIRGRVYDAAGRPVSGEFQVSQPIPPPRPDRAGFSAQAPAVAVDADGDFVVAWGNLAEDDLGMPIYGPVAVRRFGPAGGAKGNQQLVGDGGLPAVAVSVEDDGDYALVYNASGPSDPPGVYGYRVQRYTAGGVRRGSPQRLEDPRGTSDPSADMAADGTLVVAWTSQTPVAPGGSTYLPAVRVQRFGPAGPALGGSFLASGVTGASEQRPDVSVNRAGEVALSWAADFPNGGAAGPDGVYVRRFAAGGSPRAAAFWVGAGSEYTGVSLADTGRLFVAWLGGGLDLHARQYTAAGAVAGGDVVVNVASDGGAPSLDADGRGDVLAVWDSYGAGGGVAGVFGRSFTADGTQPPPPPPPTAGSVAGALFNDANASGVRDTGEPGLGGWRVFVDADRDGVWDAGERSVLTDAAGTYKLANLPAGTHRVRQVAPSGWRRTRPTAGYYDVAVPAAGGTFAGRDFGDTQMVLIAGTVFNDANGDRTRQSSEAGLSNWRVYLDADRDGTWDAGERSVLTDAAGAYKFGSLPAGAYVVRVVQRAGWTRTAPTAGYHAVTLAAGQIATGRLFGQRRVG